MTIDDMLDALEAAIFRLHASNGHAKAAAPAANGNEARAGALRAQMERTGVTSFDFNSIYGVPAAEVEEWLRGGTAVPEWVPTSVRILGMISPSARRRLRTPSQRHNNPVRTHPFSRIEEL